MQLVIIAGGFGTRLRPLTLHRPKALVPLLNRPQVLHVLDRLPPSIDEVILAVNYLDEQVRAYFESRKGKPDVVVVNEPEPLGTGGAIKNVEDRVSGSFAVCNGDVVDSLDLAELVAFHRASGGIGSVAVWPVEDPTAFGVVALDRTRITRFVEKPSEGEAPSNLVNAGHYVFEPEIFDFIERGGPVSLEREVFPKLLDRGLFAYRWTGYWSDAGTLPAYLHAQRLLLDAGHAAVSKEAETSRGEVRGPVLIGPGCFVEGRIGPSVVLGRGCKIGRAEIEDAALFDGASVDDKVRILSSIVGEGAAIGEGSHIRNTIIGDGVQVAPYSTLVGARVGS